MRQIEGRNPVYESLRAGNAVEKIIVQNSSKDDPRIKEILKLAKGNIKIEFREEIDTISKTNKRHQGIIAFAKDFEKIKLPDVINKAYESGKKPLVILLSGTVYEHNLGSVLRSSECFGADAVIISNKSFGLTPIVIKSSAGASEHIPVIKTDLHLALKDMQKLGLKISAISEKAKISINKTNLDVPICIIVGTEDSGIMSSLEKFIDEHIRIDTSGKVESLNMASACSIALYETSRQRDK